MAKELSPLLTHRGRVHHNNTTSLQKKNDPGKGPGRSHFKITKTVLGCGSVFAGFEIHGKTGRQALGKPGNPAHRVSSLLGKVLRLQFEGEPI